MFAIEFHKNLILLFFALEMIIIICCWEGHLGGGGERCDGPGHPKSEITKLHFKCYL